MSDLSDVLSALTQAIATVLITGPYIQGNVVTADNGNPVRIANGWPSSSDLDKDLLNGVTNISVYPTDIVRIESPFQYKWQLFSITPQTIQGTTSGNTLTMSGTPTSGQVFGIAINRHGFSVRLSNIDTLNSALQRLSLLINGSMVNANVLTLPSPMLFDTEHYYEQGTDSTMFQYLDRQCQVISINLFAPNPFLRNVFGSAIKQGVDALRVLQLADGLATSKPKYMNTHYDDVPENTLLWRRTDRYELEYQSALFETFPPVLFIGGLIQQTALYGQT
jgi:hypothetical protein